MYPLLRVDNLYAEAGDRQPAGQAAVGGYGVALNAQLEGMNIPSKQEKYKLIVNRKYRWKDKMWAMSSGEEC